VLLAVLRAKPTSANGHAVRTKNGDAAERADEQVVGYAVVRGSCIIEMMVLPKCGAARVQLLARACREAMDRDHHWISLYTPAADPLHELLVMAGGAWIDDRNSAGPRWMLRLLAPEKWVERGYPLWRRRARLGSVPRPFALGLSLGEAKFLFTLTRRSSRFEQVHALPADYLEGERPTIESLLVGNLAVNEAIARGDLRLSRPELGGPVAALFSPRLFWQSPLELMRL
jgi:hypothetical protein